MKNFQDSDYAANKYASGIVYRFANQTVEITLEDYLRENPSKTEADFAELKVLSDKMYLKQARKDNSHTYRNVSLYGLEETDACAVPSPEDAITNQPELTYRQKRQRENVIKAWNKLSYIQKRRYFMSRVSGLSTREIAEREGVNQRSVMDSIELAEKKIMQFVVNSKK